MKTYDVIIMTEGSDPVFNVARGIGGYKIASALRNEGYSVFVLNNFTIEFISFNCQIWF